MGDPEIYDEATERLWPDPDDGPFTLTLYWARRGGGRLDVVGVRLLPYDPGERPAIGTSTLRELRLAEIATEERERLPYVLAAPERAARAAVDGMRPATVRRLQRATGIYQAAWQAGEHPTQAVARGLNVTAQAAANLVRRARLAGFLPETEKGKPSA